MFWIDHGEQGDKSIVNCLPAEIANVHDYTAVAEWMLHEACKRIAMDQKVHWYSALNAIVTGAIDFANTEFSHRMQQKQMASTQTKTILITDTDGLPPALRTPSVRIACLAGSPVYHVALDAGADGIWKARCGAGSGAGHGSEPLTLAQYHQFRLCRACVE